MSAGIGQLSQLLKPGFYEALREKTSVFVKDIQDFADQRGYTFRIFTIGSLFWFAFTKEDIRTAAAIDASSMQYFKVLHRELLNRGVYMGPSGYEVGFVSAAHSEIELEMAKKAIFDSLDIVFAKDYA